MTEYVYKPVRKKNGKRIESRLFSGRYSLAYGERARTIPLHTPDEAVARKKLRDFIVERQKEAAGLIAPAAIREAAAAPLHSLLAEYTADLAGRGLESEHVKATVRRIERILSEVKWKRLADIRPDQFVAWRSRLTCSAKTKKEYQTSVNAFLNWLVRMGKVAANPLAKVDRVDIRGKAVRKSRAFTQAEFAALIAAAPESRRLVYLFLAYTGARKNEAAALRWSDVTFTGKPSVLLRAENTKSKEKRPVPLKVELAGLLRSIWEGLLAAELRDGGDVAGYFVFSPFPSDDALHADLRRAGIERVDSSGRVLHFHAFRKTFQTWGAVAGIGQRSAQEMLGHSDPSLTAGVYTDVAALQLHAEVAKLPWVGGLQVAQIDTQKSASPATHSRFRGLLAELVELAKGVVSEGENTSSGPDLIGCPTWIRTTEKESAKLSEAFASYLAGAGCVAIDAQVDLAHAAIGVLRVAEGRAAK